jgi:Flp pilus assembly protein TadG
MARPAPSLRALVEDRSGITAIATGLLLTTMMGFAAMAIDLGTAYSAKRAAQNAADSAAFSAAVSELAGATNTSDQAKAVAAQYGFSDGTGGVQVTVNTPPTSGAFTSNAQAVEVIVVRPAARFFGGFLSQASNTVRGRAVALAGSNGNGCVIAFDPTAPSSVLVNGNPNVNLAGCSLYADSNNASALLVNGSASLNADSINLFGSPGYTENGNVTVTAAHGIHSNQAAIADPYAGVNVPAYSGCNYTGQIWNGGTVTVQNSGTPVVFCNGLTINGGANVTFQPGIYIIDRGALTINGGATVTAIGVTFVLTSSTGSSYATAQINGNETFTAVAPATGPTAGIVFYQDRRAPTGFTDTINGDSSASIKGALYFPAQTLLFNGNNSTDQGGCTQILADKVSFSGNVRIDTNCSGVGVKSIGGVATKLVE